MSLSHDHNAESSYPHGSPTKTGKIPFTPPETDLKCETAYWLWGDLVESKVPPLIVLHGGPGAPGREFQPLAASLQKTYGIPVLLYDQIGCGASTHLRDKRGDTTFWTDDLFLAELDNLKDYLHIGTFDLLGHSCGGMLAAMYALTQPRNLRKLIIASAPASDSLRRQARVRAREQLPQEMRDTMTACEEANQHNEPKYQSAMQELMNRILCRMDPWPQEVQEVTALMMEDDTVSYTLYGPLGDKPTGPRKDYDVESRLPEITETTVPGGVLLTNGQYDMCPDEVMVPFFTQIRARIKWRTFAESSHMPHIEELQVYLLNLGDFLMAT